MPQISPVPAAPSAPPGHSASTSSATGDTPATSFMDVLTDHQARTDLPEGQARGDESPQGTSDQPQAEPAKPATPGADQREARPEKPAPPPDDTAAKPADPAATANAEAIAAALSAVPLV